MSEQEKALLDIEKLKERMNEDAGLDSAIEGIRDATKVGLALSEDYAEWIVELLAALPALIGEVKRLREQCAKD